MADPYFALQDFAILIWRSWTRPRRHSRRPMRYHNSFRSRPGPQL